MSNLLEFNRLSDYIKSVTDKQLVALSTSLTTSSGYLKSLINQSQAYAQSAMDHATSAQTAASEADSSAAVSLSVLNDFTSSYLGKSVDDPQRSSLGNPVNVGGFYIREGDGRLRYVTSINSSGVPTYADATVTADPASLAAAGVGVFLSLTATSQQIVRGPVNFQTTITGPKVVSWTSQQLATAIDVNDRVGAVQQNLTTETQRATAAESALTTGKVSKTGDTLSGAITISATGDAASFIARNATAGSGRSWRFQAQDNGNLRIFDDTGGIERVSFTAGGVISFNASVSVGSSLTSRNSIINQTDNTDSGVAFHRNDIPRWYFRRSESSQRLYISRMSSTGVYNDTPLAISETDGSITLNRTAVTDTLTAVGSIIVNGVAAGIQLNNTSSGSDSAATFRHNGVDRWSIGRSPTGTNFFIKRFNGSGVYVDTPFWISESTGNMVVKGLSSSSTISATTSVSAPQIYASANGTGRAIAVGDDVWLGDINIASAMSVRGQTDYNSGFISFGNSLATLGCNANDATLRWNGSEVLNTANFNVNGIVRVTAQVLADNNGYTVWADGKKECWGFLIINANSTTTLTLPTTHSSWSNISLGPYVRNSTDAQDNTGVLNKVNANTYVIANWEDVAMRVDWRTVGV